MPRKKNQPVTVEVTEYGYCGLPAGFRMEIDAALAAELIASGHATNPKE